MKAHALTLAAFALFATAAVDQSAAQTTVSESASHGTTVTAPARQTPEMWLYQQEMERYDDPAEAVRRKAVFVSQQRQLRLAAMKWYGLSNSRPTVSPTPWWGQYSPAWIYGSSRTFAWPRFPRSATTVIVEP